MSEVSEVFEKRRMKGGWGVKKGMVENFGEANNKKLNTQKSCGTPHHSEFQA